MRNRLADQSGPAQFPLNIDLSEPSRALVPNGGGSVIYRGPAYRSNVKRIRDALVGGVVIPASAAAGRYVYNSMQSYFGPKKFKYNAPVSSIVTRQNDVVQNRTRRKGRSKKSRFVRKIRRIRFRRFKRSVKRAMRTPKFRITFYENASRTWKSLFNRQAVALIPIFSYRGSGNISASTALGAVPADLYHFRTNQANLITDLVKNSVVYADDGVTNIVQSSWWWKHGGTSLDLTMTNTGTDTGTDGSNRNVEYDMYVVWANKRMPRPNGDYNMNWVSDWIQYQDTKEQSRANTTLLADSGATEPSWTPFTNKLSSIGVSSRKMASGYIDQGESIRLHKTFKSKKLFTRMQYEAEDSSVTDGNYNYDGRGLYPGRSLYLLVTWRGMTNTGSANAEYGAGRLAFNCNWKHTVICDGKNQSGFEDAKLVADSYL